MAQFDYVVVGGGSAGCVLAARLSENASLRVCLVEAGPADDSALVSTPVGAALLVPTRIRNWAFETVPQEAMYQRRGYQPRGRMLGGSSSLNAMIYMRGHPSDYDDWAAAGATGWGWRDVLPHFLRAENNERGASEFSRRGRAAQRGRPALAESLRAAVRRGGQAGGAAGERRLQRRAAGGRGPLPGDAKGRRALERGARLPAPGHGAAQPGRLHPGARAARAVRGAARDRSGDRARRAQGEARRGARGGARRRRVPVAPAADVLGHRARRAAARARAGSRARRARRGREPAGPSRLRHHPQDRLERAAGRFARRQPAPREGDLALRARSARHADLQFRRGGRFREKRARARAPRPAAALRDRHGGQPQPQAAPRATGCRATSACCAPGAAARCGWRAATRATRR